MDYTELTATQLVGVYNVLAKGRNIKRLTVWKASKKKLIAKIESLGGKKSTPKPKPKRATTSIREEALKLLVEVDFYEDRTKLQSPTNRVPMSHPKARAVCFSYTSIAIKLQGNLGSQTSVACLRWYAAKFRSEDPDHAFFKMPFRRPRGGK